jgi:hypothetical protein
LYISSKDKQQQIIQRLFILPSSYAFFFPYKNPSSHQRHAEIEEEKKGGKKRKRKGGGDHEI